MDKIISSKDNLFSCQVLIIDLLVALCGRTLTAMYLVRAGIFWVLSSLVGNVVIISLKSYQFMSFAKFCEGTRFSQQNSQWCVPITYYDR